MSKVKNVYKRNHTVLNKVNVNAAKTASNWKKSVVRDPESRNSMDMPLNILAPNPAMSEQSGPLMSFPRKSSFFDNKNAKKTKKKTNEYNDYMKKG